jgi:hypothetical protein
MHSTFVPDEVLTHPRQTLIDAANPHSGSQSGKTLAAFQTRYDLFRRRHEPELYCAVPKGQPAPAFLRSARWQAAGKMTYEFGLLWCVRADVIRLRAQTPSLARRKPLSGLGSLLRVRGSRAAPTVTPLLSLFVSNIQPVALAPTGGQCF